MKIKRLVSDEGRFAAPVSIVLILAALVLSVGGCGRQDAKAVRFASTSSDSANSSTPNNSPANSSPTGPIGPPARKKTARAGGRWTACVPWAGPPVSRQARNKPASHSNSMPIIAAFAS